MGNTIEQGRGEGRALGMAQHQIELDMNTGFQIGASEALEESRQGSAALGTLSVHRYDGGPEEQADEEAGPSTVFLAQIGVEKPLLGDCIAQAAQALREVAARLEAGETDGTLYDKDGDEVASFSLVSEDQGP